jgi:hypothetical protein
LTVQKRDERMLPETDRRYFEELQQSLQRLLVTTDSNNLNPTRLQASTAEIQNFFQQSILSRDFSTLNSVDESQVRAVVVEINKQLRMLSTDAMFLKAARQPDTAAQRLQQIDDRINTLIRYCGILLQPE